MAASVCKQSLEDLKRMTSTLYQIISPLYGPRGQQSLLVTNTGKVIISSDGQTVMSSLQLSHPTARCILDSVSTYSSVHGDGTKSLIVYLYEIINAISISYQTQRLFDSEQIYRCGVAKWLSEFMSLDLPCILEDMKRVVKEKNISLVNDAQAVRQAIKDFIHSSLTCSLINVNTSHLVNTCSSFLLDSPAARHDLYQTIQLSCSQFDNMVFRQVGLPFESSFVSKGFHAVGKIYKREDVCGDMICLSCPFEHVQDNERYIYSSESHISENLISHKFRVVEKFLHKLKADGIAFILTADKVPGYVLNLCFTIGINIGVLDDYSSLQFFMLIGNCSPVTTLFSKDLSANCIKIDSFECVRYCSKDFVKITFSDKNLALDHHSLFLCAPTDSAASQLKSMFLKIMKALDHCLCNTDNAITIREDEQSNCESQESATTGLSSLSSLVIDTENKTSCGSDRLKAILVHNVIYGGGAFEIMFQQCLDRYCLDKFSHHKVLCCNFMKKMLGGVLKLLSRCNQGQYTGSNALPSYLSTRETDVKSNSSTIQNYDLPGQHQGMDLFSIKVGAVFSAVQLTVRLLRVDSIVAVKQMKMVDNEDAGQSSSDEEES